MVNGYKSSNLIKPRKTDFQGSPNNYTDTKELDFRNFENDACAQPDNKLDVPTTCLYPFDKIDTDNINCKLDKASDGSLITNKNCTLDEASDGPLKTNKNCTLDETSDGPLITNKNCTLDETSDGLSITNKNYILNEENDGPLITNKNYKVDEETDCPKFYLIYKSNSDNKNSTLNYAASIEINNSRYFNDDSESNTSILEHGNGTHPEVFRHNFERNRNSIRNGERENVMHNDSPERSNSSVKSCVSYRVSFDQRGDMSISASLVVERSNLSNPESESKVTTFSFQNSCQVVVKEIFPGKTEYNIGSVEFFRNINEIGFEKSGLKSFLTFVLFLQKVVTIMEEYSDYFTSKGNKKTKFEPTKFHLVVVSSHMFEDAMRQCHIETVELTYSNVFPSDCRMFIGVPVYKYGYIHRKDQL